jgi:hypothetical protein
VTAPVLAEAQRRARALLAAQTPVEHPIVTRCRLSSPGLPGFVEGSPHIVPENLDAFVGALRDDAALMRLDDACVPHDPDPVTRPAPASCTPFVDASRLGFTLAPTLPIVFVRNRNGELLLEARVALKYLRENAHRFGDVLERVASSARDIFAAGSVAPGTPFARWLLDDVVQPYSAFTARHVSLRVGCWVQTPPGVATLIGPPVNRPAQLRVISGSVQTDWHHFELFVVLEAPEFDGQVLVVDPGTVIAQAHFVARMPATFRFSATDPGAAAGYWSEWEALGALLTSAGRGTIAERHGVASVTLGCPHCYASVTAAVDGGVPDDHVARRGFNPAYKILKREAGARS